VYPTWASQQEVAGKGRFPANFKSAITFVTLYPTDPQTSTNQVFAASKTCYNPLVTASDFVTVNHKSYKPKNVVTAKKLAKPGDNLLIINKLN
jgi:hypothetical protein